MRQINAKGLNIIKTFEGLRLTAYKDQAGVWTIGYGHTGNVPEGQNISEDQAETLLRQDLHHVETGLTLMITAPTNDNQFSALCSLVFNIGLGHFKDSTCLQRLNAGQYFEAANWILPWNKIHGVESEGLSQRRISERNLFLEAV